MATKSKKTAVKKEAKSKKAAKITKASASSKKTVAKKADKKLASKKSSVKSAVKSAPKSAKKPAPKKSFLNKLVDKLSPKKAEVKGQTAKNQSTKSQTSKSAPIKVKSKVVAKNNDQDFKKPAKEKVSVKASNPKDIAKDKSAAAKNEISKSVAQIKKDVKNTSQNIADLTQDFADKKLSSSAVEVLLTDAEGRVLCKYSGCDELANVEGYCRYHYMLNWKRIQLKKKILSEGKLDKYINELTAKYPDKYIEMLRGDLKSEKDFVSVVNELEIDDSDSSISEDDDEGFDEVQEVAGKRSSDEDY